MDSSASSENAAQARVLLPVPYTARPRLGRAAVLVTAIAVSAVLGSMVGAWAASVFARAPAQPVPTVIAQTSDAAIARLSADIAALKAVVEGMAKADMARADATKNASLASHAQLARLGDAVEKLERKVAAVSASSADVTGSIASKQAVLAPKQQDKPPVVSGWVIREVYDGVAMIQSRYGVYEVVPGANLPGVGRVEAIRRQDGRWVAVTPKGLIVSMR
jgi:hypothetical protein